jgi:phosphoketolase
LAFVAALSPHVKGLSNDGNTSTNANVSVIAVMFRYHNPNDALGRYPETERLASTTKPKSPPLSSTLVGYNQP